MLSIRSPLAVTDLDYGELLVPEELLLSLFRTDLYFYILLVSFVVFSPSLLRYSSTGDIRSDVGFPFIVLSSQLILGPFYILYIILTYLFYEPILYISISASAILFTVILYSST